MNGIFGENLRRLRLDRNMTQEQLAEVLAVTPQAVSRWECGATFPDVSLLPGIAIFFDVSLDELMGMAALRSAGRLNEAHRQAQMLVERGEFAEAARLLRENLRLYPGDNGLRIALCETLAADNTAAARDEALDLGERLLKDGAVSMKAKSTVTAIMIHLCRLRGDHHRASELVRSLPHIWECRELLQPESVPECQRTEAIRMAVTHGLNALAMLAESAPHRSVPPHIQLGIDMECRAPLAALEKLRGFIDSNSQK